MEANTDTVHINGDSLETDSSLQPIPLPTDSNTPPYGSELCGPIISKDTLPVDSDQDSSIRSANRVFDPAIKKNY